MTRYLVHSEHGMVVIDEEGPQEAATQAAHHLPYGGGEKLVLDVVVYELDAEPVEVSVRRSFDVEGGQERIVH